MATSEKEVRNSIELQHFLQENISKKKRLYHYTTFESLLKIIKGKSFQLTRLDLLNDKAETTLGSTDNHQLIYTMSMTQKKEYISMWAMYGRASGIKLRVDFDTQKFIEGINRNFYFDANKEYKIPIESERGIHPFEKQDWTISDVVYYDKDLKNLKHDTHRFNVDKRYLERAIRDCSGFIKYDAWEFEKETRLAVKIHTQDYINYTNQPAMNNFPTRIYAGIENDLVEDFHITFNPWLSEEMKSFISESLNALVGASLLYKNSDNDGETDEL